MENMYVKPKIAEVIINAGLADERRLIVLTKVMLKHSTMKIDGDFMVREDGKIITHALVGNRSMLVPINFVLSCRGDSIYLVQAPHRGLLIARPTVTHRELNNCIEIVKQEISSVFSKKVLGGRKLNIELTNGGIIIIDVVKKLEPIFAEILKQFELKCEEID